MVARFFSIKISNAVFDLTACQSEFFRLDFCQLSADSGQQSAQTELSAEINVKVTCKSLACSQQLT